MMSRRSIARFLGLGALGFGVLGLAKPRTLARLAATDERTARELGWRDLGNGLLLLASGSRFAIGQRMLYDVSDAIEFGPRKRGVAVGALAFAALGAVALSRTD